MSPPIREDFAHGHLFCFILDLDDSGGVCDTREDCEDADEYSGSQLFSL